MATRRAYFDTSVVVKRYIHESGSQQVRRLLRQHELLSSTLTPVEIVSALGRRRRDGDLSENAMAAILRRLNSDCMGWELVEVNSTVLECAQELLQGVTPLKSLDAIQVASLITFQTASAIRVPLVTADSRQREVAVGAGIDVIAVSLV
jgi:predicted nucleic acid-binding protein